MNQVQISAGYIHGRSLIEAQRCSQSQSLNQARQDYADQVRLNGRREDKEARERARQGERQGGPGPIEQLNVVEHFRERSTHSDLAPRVANGRSDPDILSDNLK
jgi:hypothetical protein